MNDEFIGYEKMPKSFKKFNLTESERGALERQQWVVTEKIHGANFCFVYANKQLRFAKRKAYLNWSDDFFGFQILVQKIEERVIKLFETLNQKYNSNNVNNEEDLKFTIYGELFGGKYPHPDIEAVSDVQEIQTGIYYTPNIEFCAFDIAIESDKSRHYLDYKTTVQLSENCNLFYAKPLFIGKLDDALNYNIDFDSTIPKRLNLPKIKNNLAEGIVIKPYTSKLNKSKEKSEKKYFRPIIKIKNKKFEEDNKFHLAQKWSFTPNFSSNSETLNFLLLEIRKYVNMNRLDSVLSKIGHLDNNNTKRMQAIRNDFLEDVLVDFDDDNAQMLQELDTKQKQWISNRLLAEIDFLIESKK